MMEKKDPFEYAAEKFAEFLFGSEDTSDPNYFTIVEIPKEIGKIPSFEDTIPRFPSLKAKSNLLRGEK